MKLFSILTALLVAAFLYALVLERETLLAFASGTESEPAEETESAPEERLVSVVALRSVAKNVDSAVLLRGRTEAARQVTVAAETSGRVISDPLRKGRHVEQGELLCVLDPGTRQSTLSEARAHVPEARARVTEAEARLAEAEININAAEQLSEGGFASETRVASARAAVQAALAGVQSAQAGVEAAQAAVEAAETEIGRLNITAPFAGLLETDSAELGALLQPGAPCATIIQLDPIKLVGFVPETEVDRVNLGVQAGARLATGRELQGRVTFLSRSADPLTRTFRVEVEVPNSDLSIRDGQTAEIIVQADGSFAHLLPQSSMTLDDRGRLGVRIVGNDDRAAFAPVTLLRDTIEGVWLSGLPEEASVIVRGQEYVTEGVKMTVSYREVVE